MTLTLIYNLDLQSLASYGHGLYSRANKVSLKQTDGRADKRTDEGDCIICLANAVSNKMLNIQKVLSLVCVVFHFW